MIIFKEASSLAKHLKNQKIGNRRIGFVPTMGALHAGHKSLISLSKQSADCTVCSIFVNPTQFNDPNDFQKYPVTLPADIFALEQAGCDILFIPSVDEIYPDGTVSNKRYDLGNLELILEGAYRPGHFQGVCQVMDRLLHIVTPDILILGQKDYQQLLVIRKLVNILGFQVEIITGPTLREDSGLAMSSRNMRLSAEQKETAAAIFKMMQFIKSNFSSASFSKLEQAATESLLEKGFENVDYLKIVKADDLTPVQRWDGTGHLIVLAAATLGGVRLIDNMMLTIA